MKPIVWILIVLLVILHQDYWQWGRAELIGGFLPYGLAYHMAISLATAVVWFLAVRSCWPQDVDDVVAEDAEKLENRS